MSTTIKKVSYKDGLRMIESKAISQDQLNSMIKMGLVASPNRSGSGRQIMIGSDGKTQIEPTLYFKGSTGIPYTDEMNELRDKFNKLKEKYCELTSTITENI
jgi:hypothetical protein